MDMDNDNDDNKDADFVITKRMVEKAILRGPRSPSKRYYFLQTGLDKITGAKVGSYVTLERLHEYLRAIKVRNK